MSKLAQVDANSPNPVFLATNDYSVILQTSLAVGHPIAQPDVPILAHKDGLQLTGGGVTANHEPTLVGIYKAGATIDAGTQMQIVDGAGNVMATGFVLNNGKWSATFETPLSDGKYVVHARAADSFGHISLPSTRFVLKVVTKNTPVAAENLVPPQGPLGLK